MCAMAFEALHPCIAPGALECNCYKLQTQSFLGNKVHQHLSTITCVSESMNYVPTVILHS